MARISPLLFSMHLTFDAKYDELSVVVRDPDKWSDSDYSFSIDFQRNAEARHVRSASSWYGGKLKVRTQDPAWAMRVLKKFMASVDNIYHPAPVIEAMVAHKFVQAGWDNLRSRWVPLAKVPALGDMAYRDAFKECAVVNGYVTNPPPQGPERTEAARLAVRSAMNREASDPTRQAWIDAGQPVEFIRSQDTVWHPWPYVLTQIQRDIA